MKRNVFFRTQWVAAAPCWFLFLLTRVALFGAAVSLDLNQAVVVSPPDVPEPEKKAVAMLVDEIEKRTQLRWPTTTNWPANNLPVVAVGTASALNHFPGEYARRLAPEGFCIDIVTNGPAPVVWVAGNDSRGVLFGVGHLLRKLRMERQRITLPADSLIITAPQKPLRGHQLGYRPKPNSYDGWTVAMWEQYIRDLVVFGCNAIELIPPRSDDAQDSPHFPLPQMQMMIQMSRLADAYGLAVWIWYPAMDKDYADSRTVERALDEWGAVFRQLPRVDAVFVPGGDPGHTEPKHLLALLEKQTANLRCYHPKAQMWVSPQGFNRAWMDEFLLLLKAEPGWLAGLVFGPQVRMSLPDLRTAVPAKYPIRDYPDITHSRHCQYPVPDWDLAFAVTEGREAINPRPTQMARIYRLLHRNTIGFITYSEGCNDDVNKAVWSALGWNENTDVQEILRDYGRYFIGPAYADTIAKGLLALEQNWHGPVLANGNIHTTLQQFQAMEKTASPQIKLNWRFQQALYRACYDAYIRSRLLYETHLEELAMEKLRQARRTGPLLALAQAEAILERAITEPVAVELQARIHELAEALYQSIRLQLSVDRYQGMPGRGNNLDDLEAPLNNRLWLKQSFAKIRQMATEANRLKEIDNLVNWTNPGPGGYYDDLGDPTRQPHLARGTGWENDPGFYQTPQIGFTDKSYAGAPLPRSWWHSAESLYDEPVQMCYTGLDHSAQYRLRVVYGRYRNTARIRLIANDTIEIHPPLIKPGEPLEYDIPPAATADGELRLTWYPESGKGENGRFLQVAEVWLTCQTGGQ